MQRKIEYQYLKIKKALRHFLWMTIYFILLLKGKILENPKNQPPEFIYQRTTSPEKAPNKTSYVNIGFKKWRSNNY